VLIQTPARAVMLSMLVSWELPGGRRFSPLTWTKRGISQIVIFVFVGTHPPTEGSYRRLNSVLENFTGCKVLSIAVKFPYLLKSYEKLPCPDRLRRRKIPFEIGQAAEKEIALDFPSVYTENYCHPGPLDIEEQQCQ